MLMVFSCLGYRAAHQQPTVLPLATCTPASLVLSGLVRWSGAFLRMADLHSTCRLTTRFCLSASEVQGRAEGKSTKLEGKSSRSF